VGTGSTLFSGGLFLEAAQIWRELAPHYFLADCFEGSSDLAGTGSTLFSGGLFLEAAQSSSSPRAASVFISPSVILSVHKG
jgi:hypothetical protein